MFSTPTRWRLMYLWGFFVLGFAFRQSARRRTGTARLRSREAGVVTWRTSADVSSSSSTSSSPLAPLPPIFSLLRKILQRNQNSNFWIKITFFPVSAIEFLSADEFYEDNTHFNFAHSTFLGETDSQGGGRRWIQIAFSVAGVNFEMEFRDCIWVVKVCRIFHPLKVEEEQHWCNFAIAKIKTVLHNWLNSWCGTVGTSDS